jgi:hypothetical protein
MKAEGFFSVGRIDETAKPGHARVELHSREMAST